MGNAAALTCAAKSAGPSTIIVVAPSAAPLDTPTARIGKRVAEQRLHRGAGRAEAAADQQRERDARRADVDQHRARLLRGRIAGQRGPGFRERNAIGADAQRDDGHHAHETGERGQRERAKRRDVPMRAAPERDAGDDAGKAKRERASGRSGIRRAHPTGVGAGS